MCYIRDKILGQDKQIINETAHSDMIMMIIQVWPQIIDINDPSLTLWTSYVSPDPVGGLKTRVQKNICLGHGNMGNVCNEQTNKNAWNKNTYQKNPNYI